MTKAPHLWYARTTVVALFVLLALLPAVAPVGVGGAATLQQGHHEPAAAGEGWAEAQATTAATAEEIWQRWLQNHRQDAAASVQVHGGGAADDNDDDDQPVDDNEAAVPAKEASQSRNRRQRRLKGEENCQQFKVYSLDADLFDNSIRGPDFVKFDVPLYRPPKKATPVGRFIFDLQTVSPITAASILRGFLTFGRYNVIAFAGYSEAIPVAITGGTGTYDCAGGSLQFGSGPVPNATYYQVKVCVSC